MSPADVLAAEQALIEAGTAMACGRVCDWTCHGDLACLRAVHPQAPDSMTPHLGHDAEGQLIQWVHA
jgi:hypothetical protein